MDIVVASTEADHRAVETIKAHHAAMAGALWAAVSDLQETARRGGDITTARDRLVTWSTEELLPHATAEEATLYAAACARPEGRLLVEALVSDHRVIKELLDQLSQASDAVAAVSAAAALEVAFLAHMAKENEQVLPLLAADPAVSVADLLRGMHKELGGQQQAESSTQTGCDGSCSCGEEDGLGDVELDAREVPHAIRHATIFGALDSIGSGTAMVLVAPHDPLPLLAQLEQRSPGAFAISYLERGPEAWRLRLLRRTA